VNEDEAQFLIEIALLLTTCMGFLMVGFGLGYSVRSHLSKRRRERIRQKQRMAKEPPASDH
jgi:hypothetical protein